MDTYQSTLQAVIPLLAFNIITFSNHSTIMDFLIFHHGEFLVRDLTIVNTAFLLLNIHVCQDYAFLISIFALALSSLLMALSTQYLIFCPVSDTNSLSALLNTHLSTASNNLSYLLCCHTS